MTKHDPKNKECPKNRYCQCVLCASFEENICTCTAFTCEQGKDDVIKPEVKEDIKPEWDGEFDRVIALSPSVHDDADIHNIEIKAFILAREQEARTKAIDEAMEVVKNEIKECADCESERISGEGTCYGYTEHANSTLAEALTALQALKNK